MNQFRVVQADRPDVLAQVLRVRCAVFVEEQGIFAIPHRMMRWSRQVKTFSPEC